MTAAARGDDGAATGPTPFDLTVFEQDRVWIDRDGRSYPVGDLTLWERWRLARWLRANAGHFYAQVLLAELLRVVVPGEPAGLEPVGVEPDDSSAPGGQLNDLLGPGLGSTAAGTADASAGRERAFGLPELVFLSANQWLDATPLMSRLRRWRRR